MRDYEKDLFQEGDGEEGAPWRAVDSEARGMRRMRGE
jgi:hypothetical protein